MAQADSIPRSNRRRAAFLAVMSVMWLGVAALSLVRGQSVEALGYALVAVLAALAAVLIYNPLRPRLTQRRITVTALFLVPITLTIFVISLFS